MRKHWQPAELLLTFMKIGAFTFGGGYAMLSLIESICVERKKWITHEELLTVTVIAESTPGPIAVNLATFIGYRRCGLLGAFAATLGVVLPSFAIIFAISMFMDKLIEIDLIARAFKGVKLAVGVLILNAAIRLIRQSNSKTAKRAERGTRGTWVKPVAKARETLPAPEAGDKPKVLTFSALLSKLILCASFISMLLISFFSWHFSSICLLLIAAAVGLAALFAEKAKAYYAKKIETGENKK